VVKAISFSKADPIGGGSASFIAIRISSFAFSFFFQSRIALLRCGRECKHVR